MIVETIEYTNIDNKISTSVSTFVNMFRPFMLHGGMSAESRLAEL